MGHSYLPLFGLIGVVYGVILYIVLRRTLRYFVDTSALVPQFPYGGTITNLVAIGIVLPGIVFVTISSVRRLGIHKM